MKFVIEGEPLSKKRHRHFIRNGYSQTYDPQQKEKEYVKHLLSKQLRYYLNHQDKEIAKEALNLAKEQSFTVTLWFYMPVRESVTNSKRMALYWNLEYHTKKPDLDNLEKFYLDCGNGILFPDDRFITSVVKRKQYSDIPRTEIKITPNRPITMTKEMEALTQSFSLEDLRLIELLTCNLDIPIQEDFDHYSPNLIQSTLKDTASILAELMDKFGPQLIKFSKLLKQKEKPCQTK